MADFDGKKSVPFLFNPLELVVFAAVLGVFSYSGYQLVYDWQDSRYEMAEEVELGDRKPTNIAVSHPHLTYHCLSGPEERGTSHREVRISGPICSETGVFAPDQFGSAEVVNLTLKKSATVFTDVSRGELSTDFIPLAEGDNLIQIQFKYRDRESVIPKLRITRNSKTPDTH